METLSKNPLQILIEPLNHKNLVTIQGLLLEKKKGFFGCLIVLVIYIEPLIISLERQNKELFKVLGLSVFSIYGVFQWFLASCCGSPWSTWFPCQRIYTYHHRGFIHTKSSQFNP